MFGLSLYRTTWLPQVRFKRLFVLPNGKFTGLTNRKSNKRLRKIVPLYSTWFIPRCLPGLFVPFECHFSPPTSSPTQSLERAKEEMWLLWLWIISMEVLSAALSCERKVPIEESYQGWAVTDLRWTENVNNRVLGQDRRQLGLCPSQQAKQHTHRHTHSDKLKLKRTLNFKAIGLFYMFAWCASSIHCC